MPCIYVNWDEKHTKEQKEQIREIVSGKLGELLAVDKQYITVFYNDMKTENIPHTGYLVWVYWTEGRSDEDKDAVAKHVTDAICQVTQMDPHKISVMIFDLPRGNLGSNGRIINRSGSVADQLKEGKTLDNAV